MKHDLRRTQAEDTSKGARAEGVGARLRDASAALWNRRRFSRSHSSVAKNAFAHRVVAGVADRARRGDARRSSCTARRTPTTCSDPWSE